CGNDRLAVILGDNIIEKNIVQAVREYERQPEGAKILLKEVPDPQRFGVARIIDGRIERIVEKPKEPDSNLAVIGIYFYDSLVFDFIDRLEPSERGELEITDVNNLYLERGLLTHSIIDGWWTDAGTFDSLLRAGTLVAETGANNL
ncbi:MAG: sugar phosphate nucleotidyltransferase, partial [Candidatus Glassbacteria bacterium]